MAGQSRQSHRPSWPEGAAGSRRRFLAAAGTSALGAGVALGGGPARAADESGGGAADAGRGIVDVWAHGAAGDGIADDTAALQRAIDAAQAAGGGTVVLPPGRYLVRPPGLVITGPVRLRGSGWAPADPFPPAPAPGGSWLLCDTPGTPVIRLEMEPGSGRSPAGAAVLGVAVAHLQPSGGGRFRPADYPAAVSVGGGCTDIVLEDLLLLNPTRGIEIGGQGGAVGRVVVHRVWGQPLTDGIVVDGCYDILRIEDVHFWPYWAYGDGPDGVQRWVESKGTGITLYRCDNPMLRGVFCFGYATGLALRQSEAGCAHKCKVSDSDFDVCGTGILFSGVVASGFDPHTLVNISIQGPEPASAANLGGIVVDGSSQVRLAVSNAAIFKYGGSGIHLVGTGTTLLADNLFIHAVNLAGNGAAGIRALDGARARVGWQREISVAHGGPETEGRVDLAAGVPAPGGLPEQLGGTLPPSPELPDPALHHPLLPRGRPAGGP